MTERSKRLIEYDLPLPDISEASAREKNIRHGHPSTLHIWWARRPLASSRATAFAALIDDPGPDNPQEREELLELVKRITPWEAVKDGNSQDIEKARQLIQKQYGRLPRVLDPFAGGGSIPLETLRLGCETYASDISAVAYLIELCTLVLPQRHGRSLRKDVRKWGEWVLAHVREEIGHLYADPVSDKPILDYLWARTVECPSCFAQIPLVHQWWLVRKTNRRIALRPIMKNPEGELTFEVVPDDTLSGFDPSRGTIARGRARCLRCCSVIDTAYIREQAADKGINEIPLVVCYRQESGKGYRSFSERDRALILEAERLLVRWETEVPEGRLPAHGTPGFNVQRYGLERWRDLHNPRQLLSILTFSRAIRESHATMLAQGLEPERAKATTTYLALVLDRLIARNSSLTRWSSQRETGTNTPAPLGFMMIWDYAELNPLKGSNNFWSSSIQRTARAIEHLARSSEHPAIVRLGTATQLPYPDGDFDAVILDPPYYDAVPFADLSDQFYVWLKCSLKSLYPELFASQPHAEVSKSIQQLSIEADRGRDLTVYQRKLRAAIAEAARVLDRDGVLAILFPARSIAALETLYAELLENVLKIGATWPLRLQRVPPPVLAGPRPEPWPSLVLVVCRKQEIERRQISYSHIRARIRARTREFLMHEKIEDILPEHLLIAASGPAIGVFGQYLPVAKADGKLASVSDVLEEVQGEIVDFGLVQGWETDDCAH